MRAVSSVTYQLATYQLATYQLPALECPNSQSATPTRSERLRRNNSNAFAYRSERPAKAVANWSGPEGAGEIPQRKRDPATQERYLPTPERCIPRNGDNSQMVWRGLDGA